MAKKVANEFELLLIQADLQKKGVKYYQVLPGNDAVWVTYGYINSYYIFRNGQIADIQID